MRTAKVKDTRPRVHGGKFNSIGSAQDQEANAALVVRLLGEVGVDGYPLLTPDDKLFVDDVRLKVQAVHGTKQKVMFGWRQVEKMVEVAGKVKEARRV